VSLALADKLTRAVMYEGYLLYPYTPSAIKNRQRWTFGTLYPGAYTESRAGADAPELQCECLALDDTQAEINVRLRFLHLVLRTSTDGEWEEAVEREQYLPSFSLPALSELPVSIDFEYPENEEAVAAVPELRRLQRPVSGRVQISTKRLLDSLYRCTVRVTNTSAHLPATRNEAMLHSMVATHLVLSISGGRFLSMIDPPEPYRRQSQGCRNSGTWPVLLGQPGDSSYMLAAPIILYDYPQIAPESPGDLFDAGEIDEVLSLRIRTLTDEEKQQIRNTDAVGRAMLERTERLTDDDLLRLHGTWRRADGRTVERGFRVGDRVRIRPKKCADAFDLILSGMTGRVVKIEHDVEDGVHVIVAVDDDPGRDLDMKAQLGHRFFYRPEDLEIV